MVFKTKIKCPVCEGAAKLSKTSIEVFDKAITLKDNPIYKCSQCGETSATSNIVDKTLKEAKKQFGFCRQIVSTGGSLAIILPTDLAKFYKLKKGEKNRISASRRKTP